MRPCWLMWLSSQLYLIGVLPEFQGHGVGRRLIGAVASRLLEQGVTSLRVLVVSVNPHRRFYEGPGGRLVGGVPYDWNGVPLTEVIYGWDVIALLTLPE